MSETGTTTRKMKPFMWTQKARAAKASEQGKKPEPFKPVEQVLLEDESPEGEEYREAYGKIIADTDTSEIAELSARIEDLKAELKEARENIASATTQLVAQDETIVAKDAEIARLAGELMDLHEKLAELTEDGGLEEETAPVSPPEPQPRKVVLPDLDAYSDNDLKKYVEAKGLKLDGRWSRETIIEKFHEHVGQG